MHADTSSQAQHSRCIATCNKCSNKCICSPHTVTQTTHTSQWKYATLCVPAAASSKHIAGSLLNSKKIIKKCFGIVRVYSQFSGVLCPTFESPYNIQPITRSTLSTEHRNDWIKNTASWNYKQKNCLRKRLCSHCEWNVSLENMQLPTLARSSIQDKEQNNLLAAYLIQREFNGTLWRSQYS